MSKENFEKLVKKAILLLPKHIRKKMDNVAIVIKKKPSQHESKKARIRKKASLLGLYQGIPKTTWGRDLRPRLPDKITIFQEPIENSAGSEEEMAEIVKNVVWHEIAHYFGFNEKEVRELAVKRKKRILRKI